MKKLQSTLIDTTIKRNIMSQGIFATLN